MVVLGVGFIVLMDFVGIEGKVVWIDVAVPRVASVGLKVEGDVG